MPEPLAGALLAVDLVLAEARVTQSELALLVPSAHDETHPGPVHRRRLPQHAVALIRVLPALGCADGLEEEGVEFGYLGRPVRDLRPGLLSEAVAHGGGRRGARWHGGAGGVRARPPGVLDRCLSHLIPHCSCR